IKYDRTDTKLAHLREWQCLPGKRAMLELDPDEGPYMIAFIVKRVLQSVLTVLGVVTAAFFLVRLAGDPALLLLSAEATAEDVAHIRSSMGLDRPLFIQYLEFILRAVQGDFGVSMRQNISAMSLVLERVPATLELAL